MTITNLEIKIPHSAALKLGDFFDGESRCLLDYMPKSNIVGPTLVV